MPRPHGLRGRSDSRRRPWPARALPCGRGSSGAISSARTGAGGFPVQPGACQRARAVVLCAARVLMASIAAPHRFLGYLSHGFPAPRSVCRPGPLPPRWPGVSRARTLRGPAPWRSSGALALRTRGYGAICLIRLDVQACRLSIPVARQLQYGVYRQRGDGGTSSLALREFRAGRRRSRSGYGGRLVALADPGQGGGYPAGGFSSMHRHAPYSVSRTQAWEVGVKLAAVVPDEARRRACSPGTGVSMPTIMTVSNTGLLLFSCSRRRALRLDLDCRTALVSRCARRTAPGRSRPREETNSDSTSSAAGLRLVHAGGIAPVAMLAGKVGSQQPFGLVVLGGPDAEHWRVDRARRSRIRPTG